MPESAALELMKRRRSCREFLSDPVSREQIDVLLEAAYNAPSGSGNRGLWIIVVDDPELKAEIRKRCEPFDLAWVESRPEPLRSRLFNLTGFKKEKDYLTLAPYLLLVVSEKGNPADYPYSHESAWTAIENICLAATDLDLATLTYTPEILRTHSQRALHDLFGLGPEKRIQTIIPVGYMNQEKMPERERDTKWPDKLFLNRWDNNWKLGQS